VTGDADGSTLWQLEGESWVYVGDVAPVCLEEFARSGVDEAVSAALVPDIGSCPSETTTPAGATSGGAALTDPQAFLEAFLATWWSGDTAGMAAFATPEALASFVATPGRGTYQLNWIPSSCQLGSSGAGGCSFALVSPEGGGINWSVSYRETDASGRLIIDGLVENGGGA